jgi:tetratricopeptide (TPR) repeat protein
MMRHRRLLLTVLLALVAIASALAVVGPWRNHRTPQVPPVPEVARAARAGRPVLFVGLDGADWQLLDRYMASGAMPNLAALVAEGAGGVLSSQHPLLSPLVWTTMMTGASPVDHRILDFTRFNPLDGREEPITSDERRLPAVWNMATAAGRRVAVIGLWATFPAEAVNGLMVSDRLFPSLLRTSTDAAGTVYPSGRTAWARAARRSAEDGVGLVQLREYLPWLDEATLSGLAAASNPYSHPATALRRILVETRLAHALGTEAIGADRPDLAIVYFEGTDSIGHVFSPFAPPRQSSVAPEDFERYQQVPGRYFRYVDGLLGEYRRMAAERDTVLFLASDHGFLWGEGRPARVSSFAPATAAEWHRAEGVYLLWGAGVVPAPGHPGRGSVEQVAATLLALLGLAPSGLGAPLPPVSPDLRPSLDYLAHYRPAQAVSSASGTESQEAIEKLRALGYVGGGAGGSRAPGASRPPGSTRTSSSWANEGLILRLQGRGEPALDAARKALALDPDQATALWLESDLLFARGDSDSADPLLVRAFALGLPGGVRYLAARADAYRRSGQATRATRLLTAAVEARPQDPEAWRVRGAFALARGDCASARDDAERAQRLLADDPATLGALGVARLCLGDEAGAQAALAAARLSLGAAHRSLAQGFLARGDLARAEREARAASGEGDIETALLLAEIDLRRNRPREAIDRLDAIRNRVRTPGAAPVPNLELFRGDALARLDRGVDAEAAFREEIRAFPGSTAPYQRLALVLALGGRDRAEVRQILQSMYDARPRRETAALAARTLHSAGDAEGAAVWEQRAAVPGKAR